MAERIRHRRELPGRALYRRAPGAVYAVGAVIALVIIALAYSVIAGQAPAQLEDHVLTEAVGAGQHSVAVRFEVYKAPLAEAQCQIVVYDKSQSVIAHQLVTIGPNNKNERSTTHTVVVAVRTGAPASADLSGCRITRTR